MPGEDAVLLCERCEKELDRGDHLIYSLEAPMFCNSCREELQVLADWDEDLAERFLKDQYDTYVRALEEISWKADQG